MAIKRSATRSVDRNNWTAVIAAAGRGSRLRFDKPKILFPVGGQTILERLLDLLEPLCERLVFVLSLQGRDDVEPELAKAIPGRYLVAIQAQALGMADAVRAAVPLVETHQTLIIWGDQPALKRSSVAACMGLHEQSPSALATCPTVIREQPYIHFERDASGRVTHILQKREGDVMPHSGESDAGLFLFRTSALRHYLPILQASRLDRGHLTGESNFLPIFTLLDSAPGNLLCPQVVSLEESMGVNTQQDACALEELLVRSTTA